MSPASGHVPVMKEAMLSLIAPQDGGVYVDGTFGGGGYSEALLESASCVVYGIDRDAGALRAGEALSVRFDGRLILVHGRFGEMATLLASHQVSAVDGIVLDLGLSSRQLDDGARGFSFRLDGPLDMRMDRDDPGPTAADLVNGESESGLAAIIADFGEERRARAIARAIVAARAEGPITSTGQLAEIVRRAVARRPQGGIDPATRAFQALRIRVNDEIGEIERGLRQIEQLLRPGGRTIVVSFHSLEDRPVKRFFRERSERRQPNRHEPPSATKSPDPTFRLLTRRARKPRRRRSLGQPAGALGTAAGGRAHRRAAVAREARRMMRHLVLISIAAFVVAMLALFLVKHEVRGLERELAALEHERQSHVEAIRVLRSEWSYLTRPSRLAALAERHLPLEPVAPAQVRWLPQRPSVASPFAMPIGGEREL